MVKLLPAMRETWIQSLGWEDGLEKEMATHSSTLAWKIPWTEKPGRLQYMGSQSQTQLSDFTFTFCFSYKFAVESRGQDRRVMVERSDAVHWGREWQTTSVFLP